MNTFNASSGKCQLLVRINVKRKFQKQWCALVEFVATGNKQYIPVGIVERDTIKNIQWRKIQTIK